jgi:hypothetical protein
MPATHDYEIGTLGGLPVYRCIHCGAGYATLNPPPVKPCPKHPSLTEPKPAPKEGPGTELKKLLGRIGIKATATCSCNAHARDMDEKGVEWVRANLDLVSGWLEKQAKNRGLPYSHFVGKKLIELACSKAEKKAVKS